MCARYMVWRLVTSRVKNGDQVLEILSQLEEWLPDGKLINQTDLVQGLENAPRGIAKADQRWQYRQAGDLCGRLKCFTL